MSASRRRAALILRIAVPLVTLLLCFVMIELVARVIIGRGTMHLGIEMWKYARNAKVRSANPEIGHRNKPNVHLPLMGVEVRTNSHGLRDHTERSEAKPPGTYRILVLGDSITFGWGANYEKTFCRLLEKSLTAQPPIPGRKFEVLNTGVGNSNTAMEVEYFKEEGWKFQPDLVLVGWFINDAEPTPVPSRNWLAYHSFAYVWLDSALDSVMRNTKTRETYREYYRGLYGDDQAGWQKCQRAFASLASFCREKSIPCRVLLIPELHSLGAGYEFADIHDKIRALSARENLPTLELLSAFPGDGDPMLFWVCPSDAHPNDPANELMATAIDRALRTEQWCK